MEQAIILSGPAGCGKSYWIQKYAEQTGRQLFVCPCRKDRTLRDGRQKLHLWGRRTEPAILWLEGADDLTPEAQAFLRRILETHAPQIQFILECRNSGKLQEPIRSRCKLRRLLSPTWDELRQSLDGIRGVNMDEIREYLSPSEYSYRHMTHCAVLQIQYPEVWETVLQNRRRENKIACTATSNKIPEYLRNAYNPEIILGAHLHSDNIILYGTCYEKSGSIWAFLGNVLPSEK